MNMSPLSTQNKEITRGPPELVQHLVYKGSLHRRRSAACPKTDMVGLAKSLAYPSGEEGCNFLVQMIFTCLRYTLRTGEGSRRPVAVVINSTV
jgi:hypothetical protein